MKWWHWLILELLILFGITTWIYFFPDEAEVNLAKGAFGFALIYFIETLRNAINDKKKVPKKGTGEEKDKMFKTELDWVSAYKKLEEDNEDLKQSLDWANEREKENTERIVALEEEKCELLGIIQDKDKAIKELEEKISVLLSCKNCPENKGGYICQKEYEDKCLAQKIQYIKELSEEKKLKVSDLKLGDTVRHKSGNLEYLVTGIDHSENEVFFCDAWSDEEELRNWEKVEK